MTPRRRAMLLTALIGALTLVPAVAAAETGDAADPGTAVYSVEVTDVSTGPDGAEESESHSGELRIVCLGSDCAIVDQPGPGLLGDVGLTTGESLAGSASSPQRGSPCESGRGARTIEIEATASSLTATVEQAPIDWTACTDDTEAYGHARTVTWSGSLVAADDCVFDEAGCLETTGSTSELASGDPAARSVLSALATPATAGTAPSQLLLACLLTIILVLLVSLPTSLLNSAVEAGSDRFSDWWAGRRARRSGGDGTAEPAAEVADSSDPPESPTADAGTDADADAGADSDAGAEGAAPEAAVEPVPAAARTPWNRTWWWAAVGVAAASVISAFVDPQFGVNIGSARVVLSILVSFVIDVVLGWLLVVWLVRRLNPGVTHSYAFQPFTLIVVVAAVLFTRITGFEPGIVFGLVAGVAFGMLAGKAQEARASLVTLGYAFGVAVVAWVAYGMMGGGAAAGDSFWGTFVLETLSSAAIGGMAALPIALFPLRGLAGHAVWSWNRWVWAGCYAVGLLAFFVVLMPMPFAWDDVGWELWAWIGVYLAYAAFAVVAWLVLARPWVRGEEETIESSDGPDALAAESEPALADKLDG